MFSPMEVIEIYSKHLNKDVKEMSDMERQVLDNLVQDTMRGRYSPLLHAHIGQTEIFIDYISKQDEPYESMSDGTRWAYEDVFFGKV